MNLIFTYEITYTIAILSIHKSARTENIKTSSYFFYIYYCMQQFAKFNLILVSSANESG